VKPKNKLTRIARVEAKIAELTRELAELKGAQSPGPWRVITADDQWSVRDAEGNELCCADFDSGTGDQDRANFRLFALSERMYRFLDGVAPLLESLNDNHVADDEINELRKILAIARGEGAPT